MNATTDRDPANEYAVSQGTDSANRRAEFFAMSDDEKLELSRKMYGGRIDKPTIHHSNLDEFEIREKMRELNVEFGNNADETHSITIELRESIARAAQGGTTLQDVANAFRKLIKGETPSIFSDPYAVGMAFWDTYSRVKVSNENLPLDILGGR